MARLEGKVAVVTGAKITPEGGHNIGSATAVAMAAEGAAVVAADLDGDGAQRVAEQICGAGGRAQAVMVDVSQESDVERMIQAAVQSFGRLDVLMNNATAIIDGDTDPLNMDVEVWDRMMAVNARGPMLGCKHGVAAMLASGGGSIINTLSTQALGGHVTRTAYASSKGAVRVLTLYVAAMYGKQGIRCNALVPGLTMSAIARQRQTPQIQDIHLRHTLTPRVAEPEDVANFAVFLAGDESQMMTGEMLVVDGGLSSARPFRADMLDLMAETAG